MRLFLWWRRAEIIKKDGLRAPVRASVFISSGYAADGFPHTYKWHSRKIEPNIITLFWVPHLSSHARVCSLSGSQRGLRHTMPPAELQSHHQPTPAVQKLIGSIHTHNTPLNYYSCQRPESTAPHFYILPKQKKVYVLYIVCCNQRRSETLQPSQMFFWTAEFRKDMFYSPRRCWKRV